jgi:hypothetical protein
MMDDMVVYEYTFPEELSNPNRVQAAQFLKNNPLYKLINDIFIYLNLYYGRDGYASTVRHKFGKQ